MAKIVTLVSSVGGVGKSTLCASLAHALAARKKRVLLADLSPDAPALSALFGVAQSVLYTVSDFLRGNASAEAVLRSIPFQKGEKSAGEILLAPLFPSFSKEPKAENIGEAVSLLAEASDADFVLLDAALDYYPPLFFVSDERILLTDARESSLSASEALAYHFSLEHPFTHFLLRCSLVREQIMKEEPLLDVIDRLSLPLFGVLPTDELVRDMGLLWEKKHARRSYVRAVNNIAARLCAESVPLLSGIEVDGISRRFFIERSAKMIED